MIYRLRACCGRGDQSSKLLMSETQTRGSRRANERVNSPTSEDDDLRASIFLI